MKRFSTEIEKHEILRYMGLIFYFCGLPPLSLQCTLQPKAYMDSFKIDCESKVSKSKLTSQPFLKKEVAQTLE